mgnify:FL=1
MDADFWHSKWEKNEIGFHQNKPNEMFTRHFHRLDLTPGARVFLPLCGKTLDIGWLLSEGYAAELNESAIRQLFEGLKLTPNITAAGPLIQYRAPGIDIFVGDIFDLAADRLGPIDAVYDRAALVALPTEMREKYAQHLPEITQAAPQLLITLDYDQAEMKGPPFAIDEAELRRLYSAAFQIDLLEEADASGSLKKDITVHQAAWHLRSR